MSCITSKDGTLTICRPDASGPLHLTTLTVYFKPWPDMTPTVLDPICKSAREQVRCFKCYRRRWAKNLTVVRHAYSGPMIYCTDGCRAFKDKRNAAARRRYAARKKTA